MYFRFIISMLIICSATICRAQTNLLSTRVTYHADNKTIGEILQDIENYTNARFTYNSALIDTRERVSITVVNKTVEEILTILFLSKFEYKQLGNQILITLNTSSAIQVEQVPAQIPTERPTRRPPPQQSQASTHIDTVTVFDTVRVLQYDTLRFFRYDTIRVIDSSDYYKAKNLILRKTLSNLSFSGFIGLQYSYPLYWNKPKNEYAQLLQNAVEPTIGSFRSLRVSYQNNKLSYGAGVQFARYSYKSNFETLNIINDGSETHTDSLWFWQYNLLFSYYKFIPGGDSILIPVYDSIYTYSLVTNPKKVENTHRYSSMHTTRYIGIPLTIAYRFFITPEIELQSTLSFIPYLRVGQNGFIPNQDNSYAILLSDAYYRRFVFGYSASWNVVWHFHKFFSLHMKPSCSTIPILVQKKHAGYQKSNITFGLEWGISYVIPYEFDIRSLVK